MSDKPEFSYFVNCKLLKEAKKLYKIEASEEERAALAKRFDLLSLDFLFARALVYREQGDLVHLKCEVIADLSQKCIVSGKPLKKHINSNFERSFSNSAEPYFGSEKEPEGEGEYTGPYIDDNTPEPPDPMVDGGFDLGETVAEQLSLEIDPFPRSPDANFDGYSSFDNGKDEEGRISPFAVLEQLKKKS
ncbi:MAG: DUF177 domain-containing protein [Rhodospirillales bacterium]|nr:DUF177 domain-containing protein [Rhodospirillales bacterium]